MRLLLFTLLLFSARLGAQTYRPFIEENTWWDEYFSWEAPLCNFDYGYHYWYAGDSLVQGKIYRKLYYSGIRSGIGSPFCPPYFTDTTLWQLQGLFREDTIEKQVYFLDFQGDEYLMYDFSLQPGDTMFLTYQGQSEMVLDSIGLTTTLDGLTRRVFHFNGGAKWVEGLGNTNGLFSPSISACICRYGICYGKKGDYVFESTTDCSTITDAPEEIFGYEPPAISPNPFSIYQIIIAGPEWSGLDVYNTVGQKIYTAPLNGTMTVSYPENEPNGIFFMVFTRKDGLRLTRTAVKSD